jgi:hypothetical protein
LEVKGVPQDMSEEMLLQHEDTECQSTTYSYTQVAEFNTQLPEVFYMQIPPFIDTKQLVRRKIKIFGNLKISTETTSATYIPSSQVLHLGAILYCVGFEGSHEAK